MSKKKITFKTAVKFSLTLLFSAACLYYAGRKTEFSKVWNDVRTMRLEFLGLTGLMAMFIMSIRAFRWHQVLKRERNFPFSNTFWSTAIGYLANNILPARAGEVIRSVILGLSSGIRKSLVIATTLTERVLDAGVLLSLAFVMLRFTADLPTSFQAAWRVLLPVLIGLLIVIGVSPLMQNQWLKVIGLIPFTRLRTKLQDLFIGLMDGVRVFHSWRLMTGFLALSAIIWLLDAFAMSVLARAFGAELTIPQATIFIAALGFASSVPSTPGYVGVFQAIAVTLLPIFGVPADRAFLLISTYQILSFVVTLMLGGTGWVIMQRRLGTQRLARELEAAE
jgi:glycosyltransferase 2 family protein